MTQLADLSISQLSHLLRTRSVSSVEAVQACLARIDARDRELNTFITLLADSALSDAGRADEEIARGEWRGPLHGVPLGIKDIIDVRGVPTTAASRLFRERIAAKDASVVQSLRRAGAIVIGKQNLHEFAYGGSSLISAHGPVRNPHDAGRIAGGSSGGSAAAVSAGFCFAAIGTDTAGSVREPASLCGVVGFKPAFGSIDMQGVFPLAPSFDHVGPITKTVADCSLIYEVLSESPSSSAPPAKVIGVARQFFFDRMEEGVAGVIEKVISALKLSGLDARDVDLPVETDRLLQSAESRTVHAAYSDRSNEYQPETWKRICSGQDLSQSEIEELQSRLARQRTQIDAFLEEARIDFIVTPTTPVIAPRIDDLLTNPEQLRPAELLLLRNTRPFNVWGLPAISIPCGLSQGLPVGLHIASSRNQATLLLKLAEDVANWFA